MRGWRLPRRLRGAGSIRSLAYGSLPLWGWIQTKGRIAALTLLWLVDREPPLPIQEAGAFCWRARPVSGSTIPPSLGCPGPGDGPGRQGWGQAWGSASLGSACVLAPRLAGDGHFRAERPHVAPSARACHRRLDGWAGTVRAVRGLLVRHGGGRAGGCNRTAGARAAPPEMAGRTSGC